MVRLPNALVVAVKAVVYLVAIGIGSTLLLENPGSQYRALPSIVGVLLLGHALYRRQLRPLEYAVGGLYAALLASVAGTLVVVAGSIDIPPVLRSDLLISTFLAVVLVAVYFGVSDGIGSRNSPAT